MFDMRRLANHLRLSPAASSRLLDPEPIAVYRCQEEFVADAEALDERYRLYQKASAAASTTDVCGVCVVCATETVFESASPKFGEPDWRESLRCKGCGLISRQRSALHVLGAQIALANRRRVYLTERASPLYSAAQRFCGRLIGSEYRGPTAKPGSWFRRARQLIRHQNVTRLSFKSRSFSGAVCLEVLEHVDDYRSALREFSRILTVKGQLLLGVPFDLSRSVSVRRAVTQSDGSTKYLLEPQYHGDPIAGRALVYHDFGWSLLGDVRDAGFTDVRLGLIWSSRYAYLEWGTIFIVATK